MNVVNPLDFFISHFGHRCVSEEDVGELRNLIERFVNDHPEELAFADITDSGDFYQSCFWITYDAFIEDLIDSPNQRDNFMMIVALAKLVGVENIFDTPNNVNTQNMILKLESVINGEYAIQ